MNKYPQYITIFSINILIEIILFIVYLICKKIWEVNHGK